MFKSLFGFAAGVLLSCASAYAQSYNFTVAGYSPGGLVSSIGLGMDAALAAAHPGSTVTYQTSSGGLANAMLVSQGKVEMGLIADHETPTPWYGRPPFKEQIKNIRLLFRPYAGDSRFYLTHVIARKDWAQRNDVKTFADLGAKKPRMTMAINRVGNNDGEVSLSLLKAVGVTPESIAASGGQLVRAASGEMKSLILDRRIDLFVLGISYNHPSIQEVANGVDVVMLPLAQTVARKVGEEWSGKACSIKPDEYKFLDTETYAPCIGMGTYVRETMDEGTAYRITKAMFENIDKFRAAHRALAKVVTREAMMEPGIVPHHPGALRYFKEAGLLK